MSSKPTVKLMLDSGAFSAYTRGIPVSIDDYIKFIKRNEDLISCYVNMDVIPGSPSGRSTRNQKATDRSARLSYDNLQRMKDKGLRPIPVFHQGESFDWLERLIDDKEPYIGFSRYKRSSRKEIHIWLDHCFRIISQSSLPIKTHGFAFTNTNVVKRYPWTTVDSTSWAIKASYGQVLIPSLSHEEPDFSSSTIVRFSPRIGKNKASNPYGMFSPDASIRRAIDKYIREQSNFHVESLSNSQYARYALNIVYFLGLEKYIQQNNQFSIVFATLLNIDAQGILLTQHNANFRLLSYFELRDLNQDDFERYVTAGSCSPEASTYDWKNRAYLNHRYESLIKHIEEAKLCAE